MIKIHSGKKKLKKLLSYSADASKGRNWRQKDVLRDGGVTAVGLGKPSVYHATVVIFLEFFAWGLLTVPVITVLSETFPDQTFLMNGLIQGIKGILSFLSAPLVGALSDVWGRKSFLLVTVFFTCAPIPLLRFNPWWFFACLSVSGVFAVTFSVVFAYVADCTTAEERPHAYGLVSATFAASLITSPALGGYLGNRYNDGVVVAVATAIALLDVLFILLCVPESLPERMRPRSWGSPISWELADPFSTLKKIFHDSTILLLATTIFLSYLPEAGQMSCIFLYLQQVIAFTRADVAKYIAIVGFLSVICQTFVMNMLIKQLGLKNSIILALGFQMIQLLWYGFGTKNWMMWAAGSLAAMSSLTYPALSALISANADSDQQGAVQGIVTGIRGLCNGIGPALFGLIFYIFHVNLKGEVTPIAGTASTIDYPKLAQTINTTLQSAWGSNRLSVKTNPIIPGPPFLFGACMVFLSLLTALFLPEAAQLNISTDTKTTRTRSDSSSHGPDYASVRLSNSEYDSAAEG